MNNSVPKASLREKTKRYAEGIPSGKTKSEINNCKTAELW
jgi:hypothetical protein